VRFGCRDRQPRLNAGRLRQVALERGELLIVAAFAGSGVCAGLGMGLINQCRTRSSIAVAQGEVTVSPIDETNEMEPAGHYRSATDLLHERFC
jgi:hypothetical protein